MAKTFMGLEWSRALEIARKYGFDMCERDMYQKLMLPFEEKELTRYAYDKLATAIFTAKEEGGL